MTASRQTFHSHVASPARRPVSFPGVSAGGASAEGTDSPRYPDNDDLGTFVSFGEACDAIVGGLCTGRDLEAQDAVERGALRPQVARGAR